MDSRVEQDSGQQNQSDAAEPDLDHELALNAVRCPVCDGTGRLRMSLPIFGNDDCPACWSVGVVAAEVAPYLVRRKSQAPALRLMRKQAC